MLTEAPAIKANQCTIYESVAETIGLIGTASSENANHSLSEGKGWLGVATVDDVKRLLSDGWDAGVKRVSKNLGDIEIEARPVSIKRRKVRGDFGDDIDMQAVYRGDLDKAWTSTRRRSGAGPQCVSLIVDICANSGTKADALFWRGAAALFLSDKLTEAGYSVAIYAAASSVGAYCGHGKKSTTMVVPVKNFSTPLDMNNIASVICLAGYFRTAFFCHLYRGDKATNCGLGKHVPCGDVHKEEIAALNGITGFHRIKNKETAVSFIKEIEKMLNGGNDE